MNTARDLCDLFLDEAIIVTTEGRVPEAFDEIKSTDGVVLPKETELVVLIDGGSASASEVTAACLQDLGRAAIAGQRSFGKGSVQNVVEMDGGRSRLRLTIAYWYPPSKRNVNRDTSNPNQEVWGVDPDPQLRVELSDAQRERVFTRMFLRDTGKLGAEDLIQFESDRKAPSTENSADANTQEEDYDLSKLGKPEHVQHFLSADPSLKFDPQLLRVLCWLAEQSIIKDLDQAPSAEAIE